MKPFQTYFVFSLDFPSGGSYLGSSYEATLSSTLAEAFRMASYYVALNGKCRVTIYERCSQCQGTKYVAKVRTRGLKTCPACKGRGEEQEITAFDATFQEQVSAEIVALTDKA